MSTVKPITKSQLISEIAAKLNVTKKDVNSFLDMISSVAYKETKKSGYFCAARLRETRKGPAESTHRAGIPPPVKRLR